MILYRYNKNKSELKNLNEEKYKKLKILFSINGAISANI